MATPSSPLCSCTWYKAICYLLGNESHIFRRCGRTCVHLVQWLWSVPLLPEQTFRLSGFPAETIWPDLLADGHCVPCHCSMDAISRERSLDALAGQLVAFQNVCSGARKFHGRADVVHIHHHPILHRMAFDCKVNKY